MKAAQQERSRKTERAIAEALASLLRQKQFADISVAEIAQAAGISVGGFYGRFASKDALLEMVELNILEGFERLAAEQLDPARFQGQGIDAIAQAYAELLVTSFRSHRVEIIQILRYTRPRSDTEQRLLRFNRAIHERLRALLLQRLNEIAAEDKLLAINLGLFFTSALAREAVLTRNLQVYPVEIDDARLASEIAHAFHSYLSQPRAPGH